MSQLGDPQRAATGGAASDFGTGVVIALVLGFAIGLTALWWGTRDHSQSSASPVPESSAPATKGQDGDAGGPGAKGQQAPKAAPGSKG